MPRNGKLVRITVGVAAGTAVTVLVMTTVGAASARTSSANVTGAGSSFVAPLVVKWISPVASALGITLSYSPIGSGAGVNSITNKLVDFGASDAPLTQFSPTCTTCVQIPWALAATAVVYNLPGLKFLHMTGPVLAKIYMGKIKSWNDPAIKKLNRGRHLPSKAIVVVHRSDSSGTTFNFTDYLSSVSAAWKSQIGVGTVISWPTGIGGSHSSGMAAAVESTPGAIGYVDVEYAVVNHLGYFKMRNRSGKFVMPSLKSIFAAAQLDTHPKADGSLSIVNPPKSKKYRNAYPICTYTYVDVQKTSANAANIKKLIGWAITNGQTYGPAILFQPLPKAVVTFDQKQIGLIHP
jgi:phosphate transport system substrate-binding protein